MGQHLRRGRVLWALPNVLFAIGVEILLNLIAVVVVVGERIMDLCQV